MYEVTLSEDKGGFKFGKAAMPDEAKADLDQLVQQLKAEPNGAYIEIEGHTDNAGAEGRQLQARPRARRSVKRYLYEQHQVPLHKINVISYGEEKPIAPNKTKAAARRTAASSSRFSPSRPPAGPRSRARIRGPARWTGSGALEVSPEWSGGTSAAKRQHFRRVLRVPLPVDRSIPNPYPSHDPRLIQIPHSLIRYPRSILESRTRDPRTANPRTRRTANPTDFPVIRRYGSGGFPCDHDCSTACRRCGSREYPGSAVSRAGHRHRRAIQHGSW